MSRALITSAEAMAHLRIDVAYDDLDLMVEAASSLVLNYMGVNGEFLQDSAGDVPQDSAGPAVTVPVEVKQATLVTLKDLYEGGDFAGGELRGAARALLFKYYKPTYA